MALSLTSVLGRAHCFERPGRTGYRTHLHKYEEHIPQSAPSARTPAVPRAGNWRAEDDAKTRKFCNREHALIRCMAIPNLRKIFASFRTKEDEAEFGRQALYNLIGRLPFKQHLDNFS